MNSNLFTYLLNSWRKLGIGRLACSVKCSELLTLALLAAVMNSSIFIGSFRSFVVGCRPPHRSRDTAALLHDAGSWRRHTRSRPAVINARPPGPRSAALRSSSRRNWIKVVRSNEFIAVSSAAEHLQPTVALLIYLPHPSRITLLQRLQTPPDRWELINSRSRTERIVRPPISCADRTYSHARNECRKMCKCECDYDKFTKSQKVEVVI